mgnify:CR=1 FL=1
MKKSKYKTIIKDLINIENITNKNLDSISLAETINEDLKNKEKSDILKYKKKKINITEITGTAEFIFNGINFLITIRIKNELNGYIQLIPKSSNELDKLHKYEKESIALSLKNKLKQKLGFNVWYENDGAAGFKFKFLTLAVEDILLRKIIK